MATHSSILAWEIPWTEEPSKLQSMEKQRVRHNLETKQQYIEQGVKIQTIGTKHKAQYQKHMSH